MHKLNLYELGVTLDRTIRGRRSVQAHVLNIAAKNHPAAVNKAVRVLNGCPHGIDRTCWNLTGRDKLMGKVFV